MHASLFTLAKADLDAILVVGSYAVNALIINLAHALGHEYVIANLSFVGSRSLRNGVENPDERILVSEVMPDPHDTTRPLIQRFRDAMLAAHEESEDHLIDAVSLEGYVLGRFVIDVLERMERRADPRTFPEHRVVGGSRRDRGLGHPLRDPARTSAPTTSD